MFACSCNCTHALVDTAREPPLLRNVSFQDGHLSCARSAFRNSRRGNRDERREVEVTVTTPGGEKFPIKSHELRQALEAHSGRELFLLHDYRGSYDVAPVSLISRQTITRIAEESDTKEDPLRFRPNLLVDLEGGEAFDELNWVGRILRVGDAARIAITEVDQRCMMITLDPASAKPSPAVPRCVAQRHKQCAGVYATVLSPGEVRVG